MFDFQSRRRALGLIASGGIAGLVHLPAWTQAAWPARAIKIVVPNPPGGPVDIFVRALGEGLSQTLGQAAIADNKPGASGLIAMKAVAGSPADGYTLGYLHSGLVTLQAMSGQLNILKDFRPVARLTASPFLAVVRADSPHKTFKDLLAAVQANPDKLSYGSGGTGSPAHLAVEQINAKLNGNFKALHVPFKGAIESATAIVGGQVDFAIGVLGAFAPLVMSGKLRALAISSATRLPMLAQIPTLIESGLADFTMEPWGGLVAPAATPDAVMRKLAEVLPKVMETPSMKELLLKTGSYASYAASTVYAAQIEREVESDRALVKRLNLSMNS